MNECIVCVAGVWTGTCFIQHGNENDSVINVFVLKSKAESNILLFNVHSCHLFDLPTLAERHSSLCSTLFRQITRESHVLHYLLPALNVTLSLYPGCDRR